jgi:DNA-binding NtrC family response regulator
MRQLNEIAWPRVPAPQKATHEKSEFALAVRQCRKARSKPPNGLVVSSDDEVRGNLAESLRQCGLEPICVSTVAEGGIALAGNEVFIVLCNESLADGNYSDVVKLVVKCETKTPVVVLSRTGDWPEYLRAVVGGVFDYLAYPPIVGDLQRVILNALLWNKPNFEGVEVP